MMDDWLFWTTEYELIITFQSIVFRYDESKQLPTNGHSFWQFDHVDDSILQKEMTTTKSLTTQQVVKMHS